MVRVDWLVTEMNILGGVESFIRIAAPRMRKLGWDIHVIALLSGGILLDQLRTEAVPVIELGLNQKYNFFRIIKLLEIWKNDRPRLLHTHLYHAGIVGRFAGKILGIQPIIVQQAGPELNRSRLRTGLDRTTSFLVNQYVTTCAAVKKILETREHIANDKIVVIPNGIIVNQLSQSPIRPRDWPVNASSPVMGVVGRLSPEKGHYLFLDALSILSQQRKPFHAVIIGDGPLKEELLQETRILHLEDCVSWVGPQTNIQDWLPFFDLFILPSHWEGISLALLEAMAAGLPVIATSVGGNPEVVVHRQTGLLVPPTNPQLLAQSIVTLIENPSLRQSMGLAGRIRCQQNFDIDLIVNRIDSNYRHLLKLDATS